MPQQVVELSPIEFVELSPGGRVLIEFNKDVPAGRVLEVRVVRVLGSNVKLSFTADGPTNPTRNKRLTEVNHG